MNQPRRIFSSMGIELEYMIVQEKTLKVNPICDEVIKFLEGNYTSDTEYENIGWSNELVLHVIELKTPEPVISLNGLDLKFHNSIIKINDILKKYNSFLLPTGAHPFMDPYQETRLWPHEYNAVYESLNKIFGCKGHGWSNLQSVHINLPFADDIEFGKLHAAIRILLPIIPALTASTPILDCNFTGFKDSRLVAYKENQKLIPSISGMVIPEQAFSKKEYEEFILKKIYKDISNYDTENILQNEWLNSRGAIARFDRNAFEIRIIDIQEAPIVDISIAYVINEVLKNLVNGKWIPFEEQKKFFEKDLANIFNDVIAEAENSVIKDKNYLQIFSLSTELKAKELWEYLVSEISFDENTRFQEIIDNILKYGSLSTRILKCLEGNYSLSNIVSVYKQLANCLNKNEQFIII